MMRDTIGRWLGGAVALALLLGACSPRVEPAPQQDPDGQSGAQAQQATGDRGDATILEDEPDTTRPPVDVDHYEVRDLVFFDQLEIMQPAGEEASVSTENYYITGVADPGQELLMDGEPVENRGALGSFGVYVELDMGQNVFVFSQGGRTASVNIRRSEGGSIATTETMRRMRPEIDAVARAGSEYTLAVEAPSGATVSATVDGVTVELEQMAATEFDGIPATFSGAYVPADVDGTVDMGPVVYSMFFNGDTTELPSSGSLFVVGVGDDLVVRCDDTCVAVFIEEDDEAGFYSTMVRDSIDVVTEIGGSMYKLAMGGWVLKDSVLPLPGKPEYRSVVAAAKHEIWGSEEVITIHGTANAPYKAMWDEEEGYAITFYHMDGPDLIPVEESRLIRGIDVSQEDGNTTLTFDPVAGKLWGYLVEYDEGDITITLSRHRKLAEGDLPLSGITVALDPGHGGSDGGAAGTARDAGPVEKEINLATAYAVRQQLQSLGANVVLLRKDDERVELSDRSAMIRKASIDFSVSLHCNSIPSTSDGTKPMGTETYYYEEKDALFAQMIQDAVLDKTGRRDREIKSDYFKVTLNSYAPSVMVEMGFLTNPGEYDDLCSADGIQAVAEAVGDGIVNYLRATA